MSPFYTEGDIKNSIVWSPLPTTPEKYLSFIAVSTRNHEDANTHVDNTDMGMHNIDTDMHNMEMERDWRKQAPVVLDERLRHIQRENSSKATSQLFFSHAISFGFMEDSLCLPCSLFAAKIKALDFRTQIFDFFPLISITHEP
jgi:hypothetical protein